MSVLVANTISVLIGITVSYFLQHFFVFRYPHRVTVVKYLEFFLLTGFSSLVLQNLIIFGFEAFFDTTFGNSLLLLPTSEGRDVLGLNVAKAVAVLIGLVWNFFFYRLVIFREPKKSKDRSKADEPVGLEESTNQSN
jgi:putative flippase GtrA